MSNIKKNTINGFVARKFFLQRSLNHRFVDEAIGTYILIFVTLILCWIYISRGLFVEENGSINWLMFSLTFTSTYLFLFVLIFFFGHAGALFNPALVLMSRTNKNINNKETITYITAELVGTILAGLTTYIIAATCSPSSFGNQWTNPTLLGITTVNQNIWVDQMTINGTQWAGVGSLFLGFLSELIFFGLFTFLILSMSVIFKKSNNIRIEIRNRWLSSIILSFGLFIIVGAQIPLTGASCNPFRSLAPLIFQSWGQNATAGWIQFPFYLLSTITGAQIAAFIFNKTLKKK